MHKPATSVTAYMCFSDVFQRPRHHVSETMYPTPNRYFNEGFFCAFFSVPGTMVSVPVKLQVAVPDPDLPLTPTFRSA